MKTTNAMNNTMNHIRPLALLSLTLSAVVVVTPSLSCIGEPPALCTTAHGDYAATYTLKSGTGACSTLIGDKLGVQSYTAAGPGGIPDLTKTSAAIQSLSTGTLVQRALLSSAGDPDTTHHPFGLGLFTTSVPGADGLCAVPTFSVAQQDLPDAPAIAPDPTITGDTGTPEQPATSVSEAWSNVQVLVSASHIGTQMRGTLTYTRDGCTAVYDVNAVFPAASCDDGKGAPDENLCKPNADPSLGIAVGSGIDPDFKVHCDAQLLLCVLDGKVPTVGP